ncbi:TPA: carbonic anhydrase [Candidatus Sumerlaeota bacterium]|jgi:carbonic anhydrase|nr:carbonic anhydrase [Candidatus Sumerlaeota bacterium]
MKTLSLFKSLLFAGIIAGISVAVWAAEETATLSPGEALMQIKTGNARYASGKSKFPHIAANRRKETAEGGQHPVATIISCSDSRVPPEYLFDQGVGDIFVVRVAGNVCDTDEIGSAEYGVGHLKTPVLVVLGHTKCGAVTAVATGAQVHGCIPKLVDNIAPAVETARKKNPGKDAKDLIPQATRENVWQSIQDLITRSAEVRELIEKGQLRVEGAIYDISSGEIDWMGQHPDEKALLKAGEKTEGHGEPAPGNGHAAAAVSHDAPAVAHGAPADAHAPAAAPEHGTPAAAHH